MQLTRLAAALYAAVLVGANGILHQFNGAVCDLMKVSDYPKTSQYIEFLWFSEEDENEPVLILLFRHQDIKRWDLPLVKTFATEYLDFSGSMDWGDKLNWEPGYHGGDHPYYVAELDATNRNVRLNLTRQKEELGMWCAYARNMDSIETSVSVMFYPQSGNMNRLGLIAYHLNAWSFFVGTAMFAGLLWYTLRFKVGRDFSNLNNLSLISKAVIFYVLLPFVAVTAFVIVWGFITNNVASRQAVVVGHELSFVSVGGWFASRIVAIWQAWLQIAQFLFFLGYGTMYSIGSNLGRYQPLPAKTITSAKRFAGTLIVTHLVGMDVDLSDPTFWLTMTAPLPPMSLEWVRLVANTVSSAVYFWLLIKTIMAFFATRRQIHEFPPNHGAHGAVANEKVSRLFRWSAILLLLFPFLFGVIITTIFIDYSRAAVQGDPSSVSANLVEYVMMGQSWGWLLASSQMTFFAMLLIMFAIWIRDNRGILGSHKDTDPCYNTDLDVEEPPAYEDLQPQ